MPPPHAVRTLNQLILRLVSTLWQSPTLLLAHVSCPRRQVDPALCSDSSNSSLSITHHPQRSPQLPLFLGNLTRHYQQQNHNRNYNKNNLRNDYCQPATVLRSLFYVLFHKNTLQSTSLSPILNGRTEDPIAQVKASLSLSLFVTLSP